MYYNDYGHYPCCDSGFPSTGTIYSTNSELWGTLEKSLKNYIPSLPKDPINIQNYPLIGSGTYQYVYTFFLTSGSTYGGYFLIASSELPESYSCPLKNYTLGFIYKSPTVCDLGTSTGAPYLFTDGH
jgi:hypothetical protein